MPFNIYLDNINSYTAGCIEFRKDFLERQVDECNPLLARAKVGAMAVSRVIFLPYHLFTTTVNLIITLSLTIISGTLAVLFLLENDGLNEFFLKASKNVWNGLWAVPDQVLMIVGTAAGIIYPPLALAAQNVSSYPYILTEAKRNLIY